MPNPSATAASTAFTTSAASANSVVSADSAVSAAIDAERDRLAGLTRRGIGMPIAGMLFWVAAAILLRVFPLKVALLYMFFATGAVFPIGWAITRSLGGDLFAKSEHFTSLGMLFNGLQLCFWPVIIVLYRVAPEWTPFGMAVLFGSHFIGYAWLYRSRGYGVLAAGTVSVLSVAVLIAGGPVPLLIPLITAIVYAAAVGILFTE